MAYQPLVPGNYTGTLTPSDTDFYPILVEADQRLVIEVAGPAELSVYDDRNQLRGRASGSGSHGNFVSALVTEPRGWFARFDRLAPIPVVAAYSFEIRVEALARVSEFHLGASRALEYSFALGAGERTQIEVIVEGIESSLERPYSLLLISSEAGECSWQGALFSPAGTLPAGRMVIPSLLTVPVPRPPRVVEGSNGFLHIEIPLFDRPLEFSVRLAIFFASTTPTASRVLFASSGPVGFSSDEGNVTALYASDFLEAPAEGPGVGGLTLPGVQSSHVEVPVDGFSFLALDATRPVVSTGPMRVTARGPGGATLAATDELTLALGRKMPPGPYLVELQQPPGTGKHVPRVLLASFPAPPPPACLAIPSNTGE